MGHVVQYFGMEHKGRCVGNRVNAYTSDMDFHGGSKLSKLTYPIKTIYSKEARVQLRKVLDDFQPDVCHLNNFNYQLTPSIILEIVKWRKETGRDCKIIFTAHDYQLVCPNHMLNNPNTHQNCEKCLGGHFVNCMKGKCIHASTAKSAIGMMEAEFWKPATWVLVHKFKALFTKHPYSMYELKICRDYRDGKVTKEELDNAHPAAFNGDPVGTIIGNVESTFALLEYLKKHCGKRLLYVSSGEVYGQGDVSISAFKEEYAGYVNALSPRSCYPLSKRTTENLCVSYWKQYGGETVIVRPCHTYGPCMTTTDNRAHVQFFHNALDGEDILLKSAGRQMRSYNYVADCVAGLLTVLINGEPGEAYNLANPESRLTIAQLAAKIAKAESKKVVFEDPTSVEIANQSPIAKQVLDTQKLEKLGWKPAFSIEEGISHTLSICKGI